MIDPRQIHVAIPCYSHHVHALTASALCNVIGTGRLGNQPEILLGGACASNRIRLAHNFLHRRSADWFMFLDDDIIFTTADWDLLWEDEDGALAVCASYAQKRPKNPAPAEFGLGFARVHRQVFETLAELRSEAGDYLLARGTMGHRDVDDEEMVEFFPQGVNPDREYQHEDAAFWTWVKLAGFNIRIERRTRLIHGGQGLYEFDPEELYPRRMPDSQIV